MERSEPRRDVNLLGLAQGRIQRIRHLLDHNEVYAPRNKFVSMLTLIAGVHWFDERSQLVGQDNVRAAMKLRERGVRLIEARNHLADIDHGIARSLLTRNGFEEIADNSVLLAGLKMDERKDTKLPSYSENRLRIPTPFDNNAVEEALDEKNIGAYSPDEIETLRLLRKHYKELGRRALKEAKKHVTREGMNLVSYLESTRSRTGVLGPAQAQTAVWFKFLSDMSCTHVLPMGLEGGEELAPPNGKFKFRNRISPKLIVGEPFPADKVIEFASKTPEPDQTIVDTVMAHVAVLLDPRYVEPSNLARLADLKERFENFTRAA